MKLLITFLSKATKLAATRIKNKLKPLAMTGFKTANNLVGICGSNY
jgi:hypothetical protein